jgi:DNA-binding transcriptional ArsR family regulator
VNEVTLIFSNDSLSHAGLVAPLRYFTCTRLQNLTESHERSKMSFGMSNKVSDLQEPDWIDTSAGVARALAHPARLHILELLRNEGAYVMHLTTALGRPQANISQHLAILRDAGLVVDEREGMTVVYRVRDPRVFELVDQLKMLPLPLAGRHKSNVTGMRCAQRGGRCHGCHCPRCASK